jgi:hypothetical protein
MKPTAILFVVAVCTVGLSQNDPNAARDAKLIADAKAVSVHKIHEGLPGIAFQEWLEKESGTDAKYHWEVNDCGEQTGTPGDTGPVPICVEADVSLKDGRAVVIFLVDDSPPKSRTPNWKIFFAQLTTAHEKINLRRLSDLPAALIRTR